MGSHRWKNGVLNTLTMLMLAPTLGACASIKTVEWTEDVKLSDGRTIVVQRVAEYRRVMDVGAGFERGWLFQKSSITADLPAPGHRKVSWEGTLTPLVLDILQDKAIYLVGTLGSGANRSEWNVPRHEFYVVLRLTDSGWERIQLAELPLSARPNLLGSTYTLFIERDGRSGMHVDLKLKSELDSAVQTSKYYKNIIRHPAPSSGK
jgi:hypothetical protein